MRYQPKMATNKLNLNLKDFRESREEAITKQIVTELDSFPGFLNLVIKCCNADEGTSFTDASIFLQILVDTRRAMRKDFEDGTPKCGLIPMKAILQQSILNEFLKSGVEGIEKYDDASQKSFLILMEFLREKKRHGEAIRKLITTIPTAGSKETHIMVPLALHLYSQLVPGKMYEVDTNAKQLPKQCVCGCEAKICDGNTSVGSAGTWHGSVDILLNHTIAVAVLGEKMDRDEEDEDDDTDEDEPQSKQRKVESCNTCVEVKANKRHESVLLDQKVLNQVLSEAITNGFAQVNMHKSQLSHFMIPTFGTTSEHVTICLYDSENDYLLHIKEELELWIPGMPLQLNARTIVIIWLFLNFTVFTQSKLHTLLDLEKSGFHVDLKDYLEFYRNAETRGKLVTSESSSRVWKNISVTEKHRDTS